MLPKNAKANVALLRQETQFSCCAASIASALKAHGKDMTEAGVNKVLGASPMGGATWEAMLATVQYFGLRGTLVVPSTIAQLKAWTDAGTPVIIAWNPEGRPWSHASCVFHVDEEHNVHVMDPNIPDPSETVRVVPKSEFYKKWAEAVGDNLIVRRPAMAIEREVTADGRQVMASGKKAIFFQGVTREMDRLRREKQAPPSRSPSHPAPPSWRKLKEEEEAPKVKSWVGRLFDKTGESEEGIMAGKKERRSLKDKSMARFLERGPVRPADKSDAAKAMSKAQWELRKEEGRAGLPGAGLGAGYHKDKSQYNRGNGKGIEREAESLTQPLMTRRDYGAVTASDYASILKYAVDLPADVERYVEEGTDAGMPEDKAWAVAWSRYCKYKNPESEHCQMNKSEYFPGRKAKFERGVTMTVDEVADVVGPEFKEMNEDPPASVVEVREEMQKKAGSDEVEGLQKAVKATQKMMESLKAQKLPENVEAPLRKAIEANLAKYEARLKSLKTAGSPLIATETFAEMLKDGKFEKGKSMTVDEVAAVVGPEFKEMNEDPPASVVKLREEMSKTAAINWTTVATSLLKASKGLTEEDFHYRAYLRAIISDDSATAKHLVSKFKGAEKARDELIDEAGKGKTAAPKLVWKVNRVLGAQYAETAVGTYWIHPEGRNYEIRLDNTPVGFSGQDQYAEDPSADAKKMVEAHYAKALRGKTAAMMAGGKYGFTKGTESACTAGVNKLQKAAKHIANALYAKDEGSVGFLQKHAARAGSKTASMLLKAMESIGPAAALKAGKTAGKSGNGLYGFSEKTAKLGLDACSALHHEAGVIAADLFARKGADPVKVAGYLTANAKKGKCAFSALLAEVAPEANEMVIDKLAASKKKPAKPDTDFVVEEDDGIWSVIGKPSKFVYSAHGSEAEAEKAKDEWLDAIPAQKKKAHTVESRLAAKIAADFMASDETADDELVDDTLVEP